MPRTILDHPRALRELADAIGNARAAEALARASAECARMSALASDRGSPVVRHHLDAHIAPNAALYVTLRDELGDRDAALDVTFRVMRALPSARRWAMRALAWLPGRFALFRLLHRRALRRDSHPPAWDCEIVEDSPARFSCAIRSCCYLELYRELGVPEVAPLSCRMDDADYAPLPASISFERPRTLATGGESCDFIHESR